MPTIYMQTDLGEAAIIGGKPYSRVGKVFGPATSSPTSTDVYNISTHVYDEEDDQLRTIYTPCMRAISLLPEHSGVIPKELIPDDPPPYNFFTAPSAGVIRLNHSAGSPSASITPWINNNELPPLYGEYDEDTARPYTLAPGDVVGATNAGAPFPLALVYRFLPNVYS